MSVHSIYHRICLSRHHWIDSHSSADLLLKKALYFSPDLNHLEYPLAFRKTPSPLWTFLILAFWVDRWRLFGMDHGPILENLH